MSKILHRGKYCTVFQSFKTILNQIESEDTSTLKVEVGSEVELLNVKRTLIMNKMDTSVFSSVQFSLNPGRL